MPLEGDAKRDYQREYMRKKRAGKPTTQPKPKQAGPKPTSQQKARVRDWLKLPWHHRSDVGQRLTSDMGKGMMGESLGPIDEEEAMRRYQQHLAERRAPKPVEPKHCSFCDEPQSDERRLYTTDGYALICWECAQRVVDAEAKGLGKGR